jgi:hypothetical protein
LLVNWEIKLVLRFARGTNRELLTSICTVDLHGRFNESLFQEDIIVFPTSMG